MKCNGHLRAGAIWMLALLLALGENTFAGDENLPRLAFKARFDLFANAEVGKLDDALLTTGFGNIQRHFWLDESIQPRTYSVLPDVDRFGWQEFAFQFTPQNSGSVFLRLMGPWDEILPGNLVIWKQEIFYDAVSVSGTASPLTNGGFESGNASWTGGTIVTETGGVPAVDGSHYMRAWHDDGADTQLQVTGGQTVTLRLQARAVVPEGFVEMNRLGPNTPAHAASLKFMRGINMGGYLELSPTLERETYTAADFQLARAEGFDHVRLPIAWHLHAGPAPDYTIDPAFFTEVESMVNLATANGLAIIIDEHHFDDFTADPTSHRDQLFRLWEQIAAHFASAPETVAFELLNEPQAAASDAVMNPLYAELVTLVRQTNPNRLLLIGPHIFNNIDNLDALILPDDDLILTTVHFYDPFPYTHQGAPWAGIDVGTTGILFPGPPPVPVEPLEGITSQFALTWLESYNTEPEHRNPSSASAIEGKLNRARRWSEYFGRPIHVGEFGCFETADPVSRVRYIATVRSLLDRYGLSWAMWDWKSGFHYIKDGLPHPEGMREALFPPIPLQIASDGKLSFDTARGKTFAIEKALFPGLPLAWTAIDSMTTTTPRFEYTDPTVGPGTDALYRVRWIK